MYWFYDYLYVLRYFLKFFVCWSIGPPLFFFSFYRKSCSERQLREWFPLANIGCLVDASQGRRVSIFLEVLSIIGKNFGNREYLSNNNGIYK